MMVCGQGVVLMQFQPDGVLCINGVDDDGDGYVDCADQDCWSFPPCAAARTPASDAGPTPTNAALPPDDPTSAPLAPQPLGAAATPAATNPLAEGPR